MSGGPYGRGKAPERVCMKRVDWPERDRRLWTTALIPADPFTDGGGARAAHRPLSNRNVERGYGRWLTFLSRRGQLTDVDDPADRITAQSVRGYVGELEGLGNKPSTILARLEELGEMAKVLGPRQDWKFIAWIASRVRARSAPTPTKRSRLVSTDELLALGHRLMGSASEEVIPVQAAIRYRDGLIIAFLALRNLRRRNLSELTLGRDLLRSGTGWTIMLPPSATKTHVTLEYTWPESLNAALETYLAVHRPVLMVRRGRWYEHPGDRLWVSSDGSPFTEMAIYDRITKLTRDAFGRSINPHLFRDAAATTMAIHDPLHVRAAALLLGHCAFATTERYYLQAQSLEAHREFAGRIATLRQQLVADEEPNS